MHDLNLKVLPIEVTVNHAFCETVI